MRLVFVFAVTFLLGVAALPADVIYVSTDAGDDAWTGLCETYDGDLCGPKKTIAAAMSAAEDGDEVVLAMGVYKGDGNRDLDFAGKAITVRSSQPDDADVVAATVIDCEGRKDDRHRAFRLISGEGLGANIDGLTVTGGYAPLVDYGNDALPHGGAILCLDSGCSVRRCNFVFNTALSGGGLYAERSTVKIEHCIFDEQVGSVYQVGGSLWAPIGGALHLDTCELTVDSCQFSDCNAAWGGAIGTFAARGVIHRCDFSRNAVQSQITSYGGALLLSGSDVVEIDRCTFVDNLAKDQNSVRGYGGALFAWYGTVGVTNSLFTGNKADYRGAAAVAWRGTLQLANCTAVGNVAPESDVLFVTNASSTVRDSVLWSHDKPFRVLSDSTLTVTYSDVQGGWTGTGNINSAPKFVDQSGGNLRLASGSPCIDTGDPNDIGPGTDLDGLRRVWNGRIDMGAYEFGSFSYGDVNCDGAVNFDDIDPFVAALIGQETYDDELPECDWLNADVDGDGTVSFGDIDPFVLLLIGE